MGNHHPVIIMKSHIAMQQIMECRGLLLLYPLKRMKERTMKPEPIQERITVGVMMRAMGGIAGWGRGSSPTSIFHGGGREG